jgi:hypothetical protein
MRKELFINDKKETHIDYLLSGILCPSRYPWFYEHYTNLGILKDSLFLIDFIDVMQKSCNCFYYTKKITSLQEINSEKELTERIIQSVNENYYIEIWIDEYHIPGTDCFHAYHRIHPIFIYGYHDRANSCLLLQSSPAKGTVRLVSDFKSLYTAFMSLRETDAKAFDSSVLSIVGYAERKADWDTTFTLQRYLSGLHDYITSKCNSPNYIAGLNVYDCFIQAIQNDENITFKSIYTLYSHKEFMSDRFSYIFKSEKHNLTAVCVDSINAYEDLIRLSKQAVYLNFKYSLKEDAYEGSFTKNIDFKKKMIQILEELRSKEISYLNKIYNELKKLCN